MKRQFEKFFMKLFSFIIDHPWGVFAVLLISTILAGSQLPKIKIVTDIKSLLPYDEVYINDERIRNTFNIKDFIIIGVKNEHSIFNVKSFEYIKALIDKIELLDDVFKVRSLLSEDNIRSTPDTSLSISPFLKSIDSKSIKDSEKQIRNFEALQGIYVSNDFTMTAVLVEIDDDADKSSLYFQIKGILEESPPGNGDEIYISGMPVFEGVLGNYMLQDLMIMIPIVSIVVIIFIFFTYRSFLLVAISSIMIFVVDIWTLGLMAFLGVPFYMIQCVMPVILMALSVADEIHIFGRYFEEYKNSSSSNREKILAVMQEMWRPVVLTSITTAFGFSALVTTSMKALQYFGIFTAFGIFGAMMFALLATPAALILFGDKETYNASHRIIDKSLVSTGNFLFRNSVRVKIAIMAVIVLSLIGMSKVFVQDSWISNFKKSSVVFTDDEALNHWLSGTNILYLELDTGDPGGIKNPDFLKKVVQLQKRIQTFEVVGGSISVAQIIKKMNLELNEKYDVPDSSDAIAQYMMLLEGSTYERFWDYSYQKINIVIFSKKSDYRTGAASLPAIESYIQKYLPDVKATFGGEFILSYHWVNLLRTDQLKSFLTSLVLIFLVSSGIFWSFRKGIIVTAPIVLAVAMNYGIMGFCKIPLSVSVSICSSIILGIGIDYAIHLQSRFDILSKRMEIKDVVPGVFISAGKAILWNAVVVTGGFLTLVLSQMPPNQKLGLICSLGIITSLISSFLVVPVLFVRGKHTHVLKYVDNKNNLL